MHYLGSRVIGRPLFRGLWRAFTARASGLSRRPVHLLAVLALTLPNLTSLAASAADEGALGRGLVPRDQAAPAEAPDNAPRTEPDVEPPPQPPPDLIFADSYESGSFSAWSSATTDGGDLSVTAAAAIAGSYGMQALIDDNNAIYVTDQTPTAAPRYRARFHFDPNSVTMAEGNAHHIFYGYMGTSTLVLRVELRRYYGDYEIRASMLNDSTGWNYTAWQPIRDQMHSIELDWRAASGSGANNGRLTLWLDGQQRAGLLHGSGLRLAEQLQLLRQRMRGHQDL